MDNPNHGIAVLVEVTREYAPTQVGDGIAHLQKLSLFVEIREVQTMDTGVMALFISEISASTVRGKKGIVVTCVGQGADMASAVGNAVGQWGLGVLPVLARWRGEHSCVTDERPVETRGGQFDMLAGPTIGRGWSEEDADPTEHFPNFSGLLESPLADQRLAQRVHWLEMYACKSKNGEVDATCRLDNFDWSAGRSILANVASGWPDADAPLRSHRQFSILLPRDGDRQAIVVPSFWRRLVGLG